MLAIDGLMVTDNDRVGEILRLAQGYLRCGDKATIVSLVSDTASF